MGFPSTHASYGCLTPVLFLIVVQLLCGSVQMNAYFLTQFSNCRLNLCYFVIKLAGLLLSHVKR